MFHHQQRRPPQTLREGPRGLHVCMLLPELQTWTQTQFIVPIKRSLVGGIHRQELHGRYQDAPLQNHHQSSIVRVAQRTTPVVLAVGEPILPGTSGAIHHLHMQDGCRVQLLGVAVATQRKRL